LRRFSNVGTTTQYPHSIEGEAGTRQSFGWLELQTTIKKEKQLKQIVGKLSFANTKIIGYETHMGVCRGAALKKPALFIDGKPERAISADKQIAGNYVHDFLPRRILRRMVSLSRFKKSRTF
jgi:adenosylcobyric acid synthase